MALKTTYTPQTNINAVGDLMQPQTITPKPVPQFPAMVGPEVSEPLVGPMPEAPPPPVTPVQPPKPVEEVKPTPSEFTNIDYDSATKDPAIVELDAAIQKAKDDWVAQFTDDLASFEALPWLTARQQETYERLKQEMADGLKAIDEGNAAQRSEYIGYIASLNYYSQATVAFQNYVISSEIRPQSWKDIAAMLPTMREAIDTMTSYYSNQINKIMAIPAEAKTEKDITDQDTMETATAELENYRLYLTEVEEAMLAQEEARAEFEAATATWQGKISYAWSHAPWYSKIFAPLAPHADKLEWWHRNFDETFGAAVWQIAKAVTMIPVEIASIVTGRTDIGEQWAREVLANPLSETSKDRFRTEVWGPVRLGVEFINPLYLFGFGKAITAGARIATGATRVGRITEIAGGSMLPGIQIPRTATWRAASQIGVLGSYISSTEAIPGKVITGTISRTVRAGVSRMPSAGARIIGGVPGIGGRLVRQAGGGEVTLHAAVPDSVGYAREATALAMQRTPDIGLAARIWSWRHPGVVVSDFRTGWSAYTTKLAHEWFGARSAHMTANQLPADTMKSWKASWDYGPSHMQVKAPSIRLKAEFRPPTSEGIQGLHIMDILKNFDPATRKFSMYEFSSPAAESAWVDFAERKIALMEMRAEMANKFAEFFDTPVKFDVLPEDGGTFLSRRVAAKVVNGRIVKSVRRAGTVGIERKLPAEIERTLFEARYPQFEHEMLAKKGYYFLDPIETEMLNWGDLYKWYAERYAELMLDKAGLFLPPKAKAAAEIKGNITNIETDLQVAKGIYDEAQRVASGAARVKRVVRGATTRQRITPVSPDILSGVAGPAGVKVPQAIVQLKETLSPSVRSLYKKLTGLTPTAIREKDLVSFIQNVSQETWKAMGITRRDFVMALKDVRQQIIAEQGSLIEKSLYPGGKRPAKALTDLVNLVGEEGAYHLSAIERTLTYLNVQNRAAAQEFLDAIKATLAEQTSTTAAKSLAAEAKAVLKELQTTKRQYTAELSNIESLYDKEWGAARNLFGRQFINEGQAQLVYKIFNPEVPKILTALSKATRFSVTLQAALDFSWLTIQGAPIMFGSVAGWKQLAFPRAIAVFLRSLKNPEYLNTMMQDAKRLRVMREYPMQIGEGTDIFAGVTPVGEAMLERLTGAGAATKLGRGAVSSIFGKRGLYGRFEAAFVNAGVSARTDLIMSLEESWLKSGGTMGELAQTANMLTGVTETSMLGLSPTRRAIESMTLFAPRYLRANFLAIKTLFKGTRAAKEVQHTLGLMAASMMGSYTAICYATGQEPKLNPAPKSMGGDGAEFLTIRIGNTYYSPFAGFWYSFNKLMAGVTAAAIQSPDSLISLDFNNPVVRWLSGKGSPAASIVTELASGRNFYGEKIEGTKDWFTEMATNAMPIFAQNLVVREKGMNDWKPVMLFEWLGQRTLPMTPYAKRNELRDLYAKQAFDEGLVKEDRWDHLRPSEKEMLVKKYDDLAKWTEYAKESYIERSDRLQERTYMYFNARDNVSVEKTEAMETAVEYYKRLIEESAGKTPQELDKLKDQWQGITAPGTWFREELRSINDAFSGEYARITKDYPDVVENLASYEGPEDDLPPFLTAFYEYVDEIIGKSDRFRDEWGNMNWAARDAAISKFQQKWGPTIYKDVIKELYRKAPPLVQQYYDSSEILKGYWNIEDSLSLGHLPTTTDEKNAMVEEALINRLYQFSPQALSAYNALVKMSQTNVYEYERFVTQNSSFINYINTLKGIEESKIILKSTAVERARTQWRYAHPEAEYYLQTFYDRAPLTGTELGPDPRIEWYRPLQTPTIPKLVEPVVTQPFTTGWLV